MTRLRVRLILGLLLSLIGGSVWVIATDGPLTNMANVRVRTDENGYLLVGPGAAGTGWGDPCSRNTKTSTPINIVTGTTTRIIAPTAAKKTYICSFSLFSAGTDNVAVVEGTGGTCGSGTAGIYGGTTAATGFNFTAQTGIAFGAGMGTVMNTASTNVDVCLITSAAVQVSGVVVWVVE